MIKIAINGFGRIGRNLFRIILDNHPGIEVVAINDLTDSATLAHLLKYDSNYGKYGKTVESGKDFISVDGKKIAILKEMDPAKLPWKKLGVDVVVECTGEFTDYDGAKKHITAGAKKVIISAPSDSPDKIPSYNLGVNEVDFDISKSDIFDMGSCTTNCLSTVAKVLHDNFTIKKGFMSTIHSYTNDQRILDLPHRDLRRARAAAINIIPTTTGAAKAIGNVIPDLKGKLDGLAFRVPTSVVSVLDLFCEVEKKTTTKEVNSAFEKVAEAGMKGILGIENQPLVSSDYIGSTFSSVVDTNLTMVQDNLVKVVAWYDNEWGYSSRLAEFTEFVGKKL